MGILHNACVVLDVQEVEAIINQEGIDINEIARSNRYNYKGTPLHFVLQTNFFNNPVGEARNHLYKLLNPTKTLVLVKLLLAKGADPYIQAPDNTDNNEENWYAKKTAFDYALMMAIEYSYKTPTDYVTSSMSHYHTYRDILDLFLKSKLTINRSYLEGIIDRLENNKYLVSMTDPLKEYEFSILQLFKTYLLSLSEYSINNNNNNARLPNSQKMPYSVPPTEDFMRNRLEYLKIQRNKRPLTYRETEEYVYIVQELQAPTVPEYKVIKPLRID